MSVGPNPPPSMCRWLTTPTVIVVIAAVAYFLSDSGRHDSDLVRDLQARSAVDFVAAIQLGRMYLLTAINSTKSTILPASDDADLALTNSYFQKAARINPDSCVPVLAQAALQFAAGQDDDAVELLDQARRSSPCTAPADLLLGYIDEFAGFTQRAKASFYAARTFADDTHENFHDRVYDFTDPVLEASQYARRLRKLIVYRDMFEQFRADRSRREAREFLPPLAASWFGADVDIGAGTTNLDIARRTLSELDFVVLRSFVTPWEVRAIQDFYAGLIRDGIVTNFDQELSRTTTYNDRISHWLGQRFTTIMNGIADTPVKHVYSFLCWHRVNNGSARPILKPHTDREDNDWTVSIQMHYNDDGRQGSWPIWVHKSRQDQERAGWKPLPPRSESVKIVLRDGDAVLFRGRRHIHWRDAMPEEGRDFSSLLLHYVPVEFDWYDFKFVRQKIEPAI